MTIDQIRESLSAELRKKDDILALDVLLFLNQVLSSEEEYGRVKQVLAENLRVRTERARAMQLSSPNFHSTTEL